MMKVCTVLRVIRPKCKEHAVYGVTTSRHSLDKMRNPQLGEMVIHQKVLKALKVMLYVDNWRMPQLVSV